MIKLNSTIISQLSQIQNQQLTKTLSKKLEAILEEHIYDPNNTPTREVIKTKVSNLLDEAKEQFIKDRKSFVIGEQMVPAHLLEPKVEICPDEFDGTKVVCCFNNDAQAMVDEIFKDSE